MFSNTNAIRNNQFTSGFQKWPTIAYQFSPKVTCQYYDKPDHSTKTCFKIKHKQTQYSPLAHHVSIDKRTHPCLQTSATHYVTSNLQNLNIHTAYDSTDELFIGDGIGFPITHTGFTFLNSPFTSFHLNNMLCILKADMNLISVSHLCDNNSISIEFFHSFLIKDLHSGKPLAQGQNNHGVYELQNITPILQSQALALVGIKANLTT